MCKDSYLHETVLLNEAVEALNIDESGVYVDGTFGRGGHSRKIIEKLGANGRLIVVDKDPQAIATAQEIFAGDERCHAFHGSFADVDEYIEAQGLTGKIDGVLLDLGVSSPQLDDAQRGFSFTNNGPLDMRMDSSKGETAAQWLAAADARDIAVVLKEYGEERFAKRIAQFIVERREEESITTTGQLASIISDAIPRKEKHKNPATRSFQAIRIYINRELDDLRECLAKTFDVLALGGRLVVISFHSLEDRMVKRFMRDNSTVGKLPPGVPIVPKELEPKMKLAGKAVKAGAQEVEQNPRARSAVMRVAERIK
ncbi:MAG: 16S rRNA (cytosine(1402)-N(4))-methyltransferase RsmH [Gammaproteobacteria bacterium]|nr:MAG: 16S rRNA (cytosine(1402)-N(4))-methyltransferase RsmH [Gammaproteobacteria bacterium]